VPTIIYLTTVYLLSPKGSIDFGGITGSYISLLLLTALFTAVGIFCSSISNNAVISFIMAAFVCFIIFIGFNALSLIPALQGKYDYYLQQLGVEAHYNNMSRGLVTLQDVLYFAVGIGIFLLLTKRNILNRF
jgi:ABC-2 type transport system permease protein